MNRTKIYTTLVALFMMITTSNAQFEVIPDAFVVRGDTFQLTPDDKGKKGSVWYQIQHNLADDFSVSGKMYFGTEDSLGADGIVFVMQDNCFVQGGAGGGMGYENMPGNSIGVEFDIFKNPGFVQDPFVDHIAIQKMEG